MLHSSRVGKKVWLTLSRVRNNVLILPRVDICLLILSEIECSFFAVFRFQKAVQSKAVGNLWPS